MDNQTRNLVQTGMSAALVFIFTGNPVPAIQAGPPLADVLFGRLRELRSRRRKRDVSPLDQEERSRVLARQEGWREHIAERAYEISQSPETGDPLANWVRAEREVLTRARADEISKTSESRADDENWRRAELEVVTTQRARELRNSGALGDDNAIWFRAEREAPVVIRAERIAKQNPAQSDEENWRLAEQEIHG
jgi:hypothetical protein